MEKSHFSQGKGERSACAKIGFCEGKEGLFLKSCQLLGSPTSGEFSEYIRIFCIVLFVGKRCVRMTFCDPALLTPEPGSKKKRKGQRKKDPLK